MVESEGDTESELSSLPVKERGSFTATSVFTGGARSGWVMLRLFASKAGFSP